MSLDIINPTNVLGTLGAVAGGVLFGTAFEKVQMNHPKTLRDQFRLERHIMMKTFLTMMGTSSSIFAVANLLGATPTPKTMISPSFNFASGSLLGVGMALSSSCPGTVYSQLPVGIPDSGAVLAGGLTAIYTFGKWISPWLIKNGYVAEAVATTLTTSTGIPQALVSPLIASVCFGAVTLLNKYFPEDTDVDHEPTTSLFSKNDWTPLFAGAILGLSQIPFIYFTNGGLGLSSGYIWPVAALAKAAGINNAYFEKYYNFNNFFKIVFNVGIMLGARSSYIHRKEHSEKLIERDAVEDSCAPSGFASKNMQAAASFLGGFLLLTGARAASGCPSGHLSGFSLGGVSSIVSMAGMFAGAFGTSFILNPLGLY